ncbi:DOPA 4,5-dioxygenase family protein [Altererythrobacter sp. ZODW24]|uniref:DOPA 4,5-dioxygenase family protein n=1 Tax=Altererythrobacter sp. ZODW24 TaxID=2185142 RepID=UPI000DF85585|nr:DOPA 4,5-dioxygenase family protein [Altererythrobacter sp. ZODW24]
MTGQSDDAPYHAHIYYDESERPVAVAFRDRLFSARNGDPLSAILYIGELRDHKVGPHPVPQFEIHFEKRLAGLVVEVLKDTGLRALVHPLTQDDLADHTSLGEWIGEPVDLDLTELDEPGINQGVARFGKTDF